MSGLNSGKVNGRDDYSNGQMVVSFEHHEIHEGNHYTIAGHQTFSNAEVVDFTVVTPNTTKWLNMTFSIKGSGALSIDVKEGATVSATGTALTPINNNRNSSNTSGGTFRTGDTFSGEGTLIYSEYDGANRTTGFIERSAEMILKQNTTYIFRITNQTASNNEISYRGDWYEHTSNN